MNYLSIDHTFYLTHFCSSFYFHWDQSYAFLGESHNFWEIVYVEEGMVEVTEDANVYYMTAGQLLLHAPMEFHKISSAGGTFPKGRIMSFSASGNLPDVLKEGVFSLSQDEQIQYCNIHGMIYTLFHSNSPDITDVQAYANALSAFMLQLSHKQIHSDQLSTSHNTLLYSNAVAVMKENLCSNLTMVQLADMCHISESYLKRLFNRFASISPKAYYDQQRCNRIILMLQEGSSINEISDQMKFSSANYFSVFFKRMTGLPPATFLRQVLNQKCTTL